MSDDAEINITKEDFKRMKFHDNKLLQPFDLKSRGYCNYSRLHQLPINSILVSVNGQVVSCASDIQAAINQKTDFRCRFRLPNAPPTLPDFIILRCNEYHNRGGPNILGFDGAENLIPIPCSKILREQPRKASKPSKDRELKGYRIGFKVECAIVLTPFKEQGSTEDRLKTEIKENAHIPGLWNVAVSRARHPKHNYIPETEWPNALNIQVQRLNPFVREAELFERAIKIQASQTLRKWTVKSSCFYGESWSKEECDVADLIVMAYKNKIRKPVTAIKSWIAKEKNTEVDKELLQRVVTKIDATHECLHTEDPPYINEKDYQRLREYQKPSKATTKKPASKKPTTKKN